MRRLKRVFRFIMVVSLVIGSIHSLGWAQSPEKVARDELNLLDLLIARPIGIIAGIAGTGIFFATLPFTVPTQSVDKASKMLIVEPFNFSFDREIPDDHF